MEPTTNNFSYYFSFFKPILLPSSSAALILWTTINSHIFPLLLLYYVYYYNTSCNLYPLGVIIILRNTKKGLYMGILDFLDDKNTALVYDEQRQGRLESCKRKLKNGIKINTGYYEKNVRWGGCGSKLDIRDFWSQRTY